MLPFAPIRLAAAASIAFSTMLPAQARRIHAKPSAATPVATVPAAQPVVAPALPPRPSELPAHHAEVTYAKGLLTVSASNSSLNQILRDISHSTGMKITGGVADDRVFGEYGPAPASSILTTLLAGTGSNVLLMEGDGPAPAELILTPRTGGPSPPNPNAAAFDEPDEVQSNAPRPAFQPGQTNRPAVPVGPPNPLANETTPAIPAEVDGQPQSPNGVKTPQEIYDQLLRLRQQQQQQQPQQPRQ